MNTFFELIIKAFAVFITGYILSAGITIPSIWIAVVVAVVLGILNTFIKPFILLLTLPFNILTLGLFTFFINAFIVMITSWIVPGFIVINFWWAMLFSLILAIISIFLRKLL